MLRAQYRTAGVHGYAVKYSPFDANKLICAASQNYGVRGNGLLLLLDLTAGDKVNVLATWSWPDGLFDVAWSEVDASVVVGASGDGALHLWDLRNTEGPLRVCKEHSAEAYCVCWSQTRHLQFFVSGSWDYTLKLWDPNTMASVTTLHGHEHVVYDVGWSPFIPGCIISVSGDQTARIWDVRQPISSQAMISAHPAEVLSCDWCKYDQNLMATASTDGMIRGWDLRKCSQCVFELQGHTYAVRRLKFSPHLPTHLASVSYDFTTRIWDFLASPPQIQLIHQHTEFVYGLDFNLHSMGQFADCGFDEMINVYQPECLHVH